MLHSSNQKNDPDISVLILSQNSEGTIERALASVACFEEVVVVDGGSTDRTETIVKRYPHARFIKNDFRGFSEQRNFSIKASKGKWCLVVDSDECVTFELANKLKAIVKSNTKKDLYRIVRTEYLLQKEIAYGFGSSNYQERFFRRECAEYRGKVHEVLYIKGKRPKEVSEFVENLDFEYRIHHNPDVSMIDCIQKVGRYSILKGKERIHQKKKSNPFLVLLNFNWTFFRMFFKSYKQGSRGFMLSIMEATHRCLVHLLMYEDCVLQKERKKNP